MGALILHLPSSWNRYWYPETSLLRLAMFRIIMLILACRTTGYVFHQVFDLTKTQPNDPRYHWNPIFAFELLRLDVPSFEFIQLAALTCIVATICGIVGIFTRFSCFIAAGLYFYFWGLSYSNGQAHHEKIALMFALLSLPFSPCGVRLSLDSFIKRVVGSYRDRTPAHEPLATTSEYAMWPLRLTQMTIAMGYGFAGATKLVVSGLGWANGYTLQNIMLSAGAPWSDFVAADPMLCRLMSTGILFVQVSFPLVLFFPRLLWFYIPAATLFHLLGDMTLGAGIYDTLWLTMVAFIPLHRAPLSVIKSFQSGKLFAKGLWILGFYLPAVLYLIWLIPQLPWLVSAVILMAVIAWTMASMDRPKALLLFNPNCTKARVIATLAALTNWSLGVVIVEDPSIPSLSLRKRIHRPDVLSGWRIWQHLSARIPFLFPLICLRFLGKPGRQR